ncbi:MAG: glycosidase, partial [Acholeplasmataceae bacterium]|nr:glycosidase [Acholeplasmataceae bacterium]
LYNGIYNRFVNPVLTKDHIPLEWRFDFDLKDNPYLIERLGINSVFNSGAIYFKDEFYLIARVEGTDRKSFFALAKSKNGVDGFQFERPITFERLNNETNLYDIRLTKHEDGYIYGVFCSETIDNTKSDMSAIASAGIVRTKDLINWERLPNLVTKSPQQRNVILHPEFINDNYLFYTRPQEEFIDVGKMGGISAGLVKDINNPVINDEILIDQRVYHTIYETKNGGGIVPIKSSKGWLHIAHGVRNTAAGLRYVLYAFATDLNDPFKVISKPSGYLMSPIEEERIGDVSNVLFTNGAIDLDDTIYLYYASSDTRLHVATFNKDVLIDYIFNNPKEVFNTYDATEQRIQLIEKNLRRR